MAVAAKSPFYNEDHEGFRTQVRRFVEREIVPHVDAWETAEQLPRELHKKAADAGLLQIGFPESCGGVEVPDLFYMIVLTEERGLRQVEVLLVTSRTTRRWIIPAGMCLGNAVFARMW